MSEQPTPDDAPIAQQVIDTLNKAIPLLPPGSQEARALLKHLLAQAEAEMERARASF